MTRARPTVTGLAFKLPGGNPSLGHDPGHCREGLRGTQWQVGLHWQRLIRV